MSSAKVKAGIKNLQYMKAHLKPEVRAQASQVIELYESRKIDNIKTAEKIMNQLNRKDTIETAVEKINTFKASNAPTRQENFPNKKPPPEEKKDYVISGNVEYLILNWDAKEKKFIPSKIRNRNFQYISRGVKKSSITNAAIDIGAIECIKQLEKEYEKIEIVLKSAIKITEMSKASLPNVKLGHRKHSYKILEKADDINVNEGECVIDYLLYELKGKNGFYNIDRQYLIKYFKGTEATTNQIMDFVKRYDTISCYAIDPLNEVFQYHEAENKRYSLCFVVNNNHIYPILDPDVKKSVSLTHKINLNQYKYHINYDNIQYIDSEDIKIDMSKSVILFNDYKIKYGTDGKQIIQDDVILDKMKEVMNQKDENGKSYIITEIKFNQSKPVSFKNPITNQIYESTSNYIERKTIIDNLEKQYGEHIVKFTNQSYTEISKLIYNNEFGNIKSIRSNLSEKIFNILDKHHLKPFMGTVNSNFYPDDYSMGFDVVKSYSSVLLNNECNFPIFQQFDEVQQYNDYDLVAGEYYITKTIILCNGLMKYPKGWYPLNFTKYLIDNSIINKTDITMYIPAKQYIKHDTFKKFTEHIYKTYNEADAKKIINFFIGDFGTKYIKTDVGCITSSWEIACSLLLQYQQDHKINIDSLNDLHFVRVQTKSKKFNTGLPIHRHIIAGGIINLVKLYNQIKINDSINVIAFNTDSIMIKYNRKPDEPSAILFDTTNFESPTLDNIGKTRHEQYNIKSFQLYEMEDRELEIYEPIKWEERHEDENFINTINNASSALITGMPGCGKTEVIKNIQTDNDLILSFTNCAVQNVKDRCEFKENIFTFDSFFNDHLSFEQKLKKVDEYDRIIVDEYSMVPVKFMGLLNTIKQKLNKPLLFFGDHHQCLSIETTGIIYDYSKTSTFTAMCDNQKYICSYKEQFSRYDLSLKNVLDTFIKDEEAVILESVVKQKKERNNYINICRTSKTKWQVISQCIDRFNDEYKYKTLEVEFKPVINKKIANIKCDISKDMKMMCGENMKDKKLFNGTIVDIIDITDDNKFIIKNGDEQHMFTVEEFGRTFEPLFCQTIYRFQGLTIKEDYTIHELNIMTKRELYTSLSRGVSLNKVHFNYTNKPFINADSSKPIELKVRVENDIDEKYKNGKIYKITFQNFIYIGITIRSLEERFKEHKEAKKGSNFINTLKEHINEAKIELIKNYPCNSLNQLTAEERIITEQYIDDKKLTVLNTIYNRKKQIKEIEIDIERLNNINEEKNVYNIIENKVKNCLRYQATINKKRVDISVSLNKNSVEKATKILIEKIDKLLNKEFIIEF